MKRHGLIAFLAVVPFVLLAQGVSIYTVSRQTGITYSSISATGTSVGSWRGGSNLGDNRSFPVPIGFTFYYLGINYTTVNISLNGFIDFSSSTATGVAQYPYGYNNGYFSQPSPDGTLNAIAPFYEDLMCSAGWTLSSSIKYQTTGSPGNRIFTVEWINITYPVPPYTEKVNFQARLHEADGDIEFIYGAMGGSGIPLSYTTGINAASLSSPPASTELLTQQTANSANFGFVPQNSLSVIPESLSMILFDGCILPSPAGPITGSSTVCEGTDGLVYSISPLQNTSFYDWTLPPGFYIAGGVFSNTIYVNAVTGASSGNISVHGTNSCGNGTSSVLPVTVYTRPTPTISGPVQACAGTTGHIYTTQAGMTGYLWTVSAGGTIQSGSGTSTVTVKWDSAGMQTISVNYANAPGCYAVTPAVLNVTVFPRPIPTITGPDSVCAGATGNIYTTEAGMTGYVWNISSGGVITSGGSSTANFVTVTWTGTGTKSVSVSYTNINGCTPGAPLIYQVVVSPVPVPQLFGPTSACAQSSGHIYSTQQGMGSYTWSISSGGSITSPTDTSAILVNWNSTGNQYVIVNYTTQAGCTGLIPDTLAVTVNPRPLPTIAGPMTACAATGGYIYTTQPGMTNYQWNLSPGGTIMFGGGTNSVVVQWDSVGLRSISVNYTNLSGCPAIIPASLNVTVYARPVPVLTGPDTVCVNTQGNTYVTQAGMTNYLWTVSPGGVITAGGTTASNFVTVTWTGTGNKTVTISFTDINGCPPVAPAVLPVMVSPLPLPEIFGPTSVCAQSAGHVYTTLQGMAYYLWSVSPGGTITSPTDTSAITVSWSDAGDRFVTVNCTNPAGCSGTVPDTLQVVVHSRPLPTISGPVSVCEATGGHVYTTEPGNTAYQWALSGGGTIVSGSGTNVITVTWDSAGARQVTVNYSNPFGCNALTPASYPVTVKPRPFPTITGPTPVCKGIPGNQYITQGGMLSYLWNVSAGNTIQSGGTTGSNFIVITWNVTDSQYVSVNYTAPNGCTAQTAFSFPVIVNPLPSPSIGGPDTVCVNTAGNIYGTQPGMFNYIWGISAGGTITSGNGTDTITVTWNQAGTNWVSVNYNDSNGCTAAAAYQYNVQVLPLPVPVITGPASACSGSTGNTYTTQSGMSGYQWTVSAGGTVTAGGNDTVNFVTVTWITPGDQTVSVGYTNASGCSSNPPAVLSVTVHPLPVPTITGETAPCVDAGNYSYITEIGMTNYQWTVSPSGMITSGQGTYQVQITWLGTGSQWVGVNYTNGNGCTANTPAILTVTVNGPPGPMGPVSGADSICGVATDISYSASPIPNTNSYNWSVPPGAVITSGAGTTSILVDFPGNSSSGNVTVTAGNSCGNGPPSPPLAVLVTHPPTPEIILEGNTLYSNVPYGNQWFLDGAPIPGATLPAYTAEEDGDYWDQVTVNDCPSDPSNHIYVIITGSIEVPAENLILFPNPNNGRFYLRFVHPVKGSCSVVITDMLGNRITGSPAPMGKDLPEMVIDLRPVPAGVYILTVFLDNQQLIRKIFISP